MKPTTCDWCDRKFIPKERNKLKDYWGEWQLSICNRCRFTQSVSHYRRRFSKWLENFVAQLLFLRGKK